MTNITYMYTNTYGCSGTDTKSSIVFDTTGNFCTKYISVTDTLIITTTLGINPPNNTNTIKVYPNPSSDHITIDYGNYQLMQGYTVKITNTLGQQMFQSGISQSSSYISLSSWTGPGLYFVHIIDPQGITIDIRKIVLQ